MSAPFYPSGSEVDFDQIIGFNTFDENNVLNSGKTYVSVVLLPPDKDDEDGSEAFSADFEEGMIDRLLDLQDKWKDERGNDFRVEIIAERSFEDEFSRAVTKGKNVKMTAIRYRFGTSTFVSAADKII